MSEIKREKVNCIKCKHYYVTWEPKYPRACRLLGFKTAAMPSAEVFRTTGEPCLAFEERGQRSEA